MNTRLQNVVLSGSSNPLIEIFVTPVGGGERRIHRGRLKGGAFRMSGDRVEYKSRLEHHMLEDEVWRLDRVWDGQTMAIDVPAEPALNPIVDGRVLPNMLIVGGQPVATHPEAIVAGTDYNRSTRFAFSAASSAMKRRST